MSEVYDRERTAALIKEARQLTAALKVEAEKIKIELTKVLEPDEAELVQALDESNEACDGDLPEEKSAPKFFWRFWR
jgi:hypothetical protein